jgi:hypothetical protein
MKALPTIFACLLALLDQFNFAAADRDRILKGNAMRLLRL